MATVTITLERAKIEEWRNSVHVGNFVMKRLRDAGVPVNEGVFPMSVERGRIIIEEDDFGDLLVTWEK